MDLLLMISLLRGIDKGTWGSGRFAWSLFNQSRKQSNYLCPCYSNGKPCSILCSCFDCENRYGVRVTHSTDDCKAEKKKRITSTPPSLKRRRTGAILEEEGSDLQPGPWTLEESCLLDSVESFILNTCVTPSYRNISILYNFVSKSLRGNNIQFTVTSKTERKGKLEFVRKNV